MKVIFMGTPDFAVTTLEEIIKAGHEVVLVVTQPDKPKGRGKSLAFPPVKECALEHGIEVYQPVKIRDSECIAYLGKYQADIAVVAAFGQILPKAILDMPKYGCVNVHASLLPKYRGAAPIQWAVLNGDEFAGVTIMKMDVGLDTGDMISKKQVRIDKDETGGSLFDRLSKVGGELLVETLDMIENNTATLTPQNNDQASHVGMISKEMGNIDWNRPAVEIERLIRGLNPWPSAYTHIKGKTLKVWKANVIDEKSGYNPGTICNVTKNSFCIQTGDGVVELLEVQLEGKKRMNSGDFMRGYQLTEGEAL